MGRRTAKPATHRITVRLDDAEERWLARTLDQRRDEVAQVVGREATVAGMLRLLVREAMQQSGAPGGSSERLYISFQPAPSGVFLDVSGLESIDLPKAREFLEQRQRDAKLKQVFDIDTGKGLREP
jgi:hypothetical protein